MWIDCVSLDKTELSTYPQALLLLLLIFINNINIYIHIQQYKRRINSMKFIIQRDRLVQSVQDVMKAVTSRTQFQF